MAATPRIALLIDTSTSWGAWIVQGVARYAEQHGPWLFDLEPRGKNEPFRLPKSGWADGVIARVNNPALAAQTAAGLGSYLAYVPFGSVLFERLAAARFAGTAVFGVYLADVLGYCCSIAVQVGHDLWAADVPRFAFFRVWTYLLAAGGTAAMATSALRLHSETASGRRGGRLH